jgi:hypothetical protein
MIRYLGMQAGGHKTYAALTAGTIAHWVDFSGRAPKWWQNILEKVDLEGKRAIKKTLGHPHILVSNFLTLQ